MMKTHWINSGLLSYAKALTSTYPEGSFGYVWGAQGQVITEDELEQLKIKIDARPVGGPEYYNQARVRKWIGKKAADCSGLVMYIFTLMGTYQRDMTADTIMRNCHIVKEPLPGDLVFRLIGDRAVHVGIRIEQGKTVHCRGTDYGLVTTTDDELIWRWGVVGRFPNIPDIKFIQAIEAVRADMHI